RNAWHFLLCVNFCD
ncbi:DUF3265 domain-containing protein, partial [Vibrio parahaemolyticus]|nr:DUF3265 domain-containing protein [Vibrio parahaemolyticus]EJG1721931.1 DUF3265 domain-containing protein [Vibrio parahaemolyticus]EJG1763530.1 DUF3265 domain-containing protein [Vibrio parahaemolyticus]ELB2017146.1 DUF3265 domain-containing protein [Vibrio parahaemolyticus]ELB2017163.1 DUF3265 domain-containing protein [Vibrio parahaemolyticus]